MGRCFIATNKKLTMHVTTGQEGRYGNTVGSTKYEKVHDWWAPKSPPVFFTKLQSHVVNIPFDDTEQRHQHDAVTWLRSDENPFSLLW